MSSLTFINNLGGRSIPESYSGPTKIKQPQSMQVNVGKHLLKTKVCSLFLNGRCHYGADRCFYAHSVDELREQPQLEKTSLCPAFKRGKCSRGKDCNYAHSTEEMNQSAKRIMCLGYQNGHCSHGSTCRFSHDETETRRSRELRKGTLSSEESSVSRRDSSVSTACSPSTTPTTPSSLINLSNGGLSFDEFDSGESCVSTSVSSLDLFAVADSPSTEASMAPCQTCGLSIGGCICRVIEECSEVLRLL
jgi:hypothetical protein